ARPRERAQRTRRAAARGARAAPDHRPSGLQDLAAAGGPETREHPLGDPVLVPGLAGDVDEGLEQVGEGVRVDQDGVAPGNANAPDTSIGARRPANAAARAPLPRRPAAPSMAHMESTAVPGASARVMDSNAPRVPPPPPA